MATLIYSPGVRVVIETAGRGIIDITEDLQSGSVSLREEAPSTCQFTLLNHRRKYDGLFTPNDIISVQMKRVRWVPVFSGYLDQVPFFSAYARSVQISATDTLKRLKYRPWDPGSQAAVTLMTQVSGQNRGDNDGGTRDVLIAMLHNVGKWNYRNIHIGRLPEKWMKNTEALRQRVTQDMNNPGKHGVSGTASAGAAAGAAAGAVGDAIGGLFRTSSDLSYPGVGGKTVLPRMEVEEATTNLAITGVLPTNDATAVLYVPTGTEMAVTGESTSNPKDLWHVQMRWPYTPDGRSAPPGVTPGDFKKARSWWKNRALLVSNPKTLTSVVLRVADWGGRDGEMAMSEHAMMTLGIKPGDELDVRFAPESFLPGRTFGKGDLASPLAKTQHDGGGGDPGSMKLPWNDTPDNGGTLQSNAHAAREFVKANWGVDPIYGYSYRQIAGTSTLSDHAYGLAIDCMVSPGQYASGSAKAKGNAIAVWFAANPDVFGTKYVIWTNKINSGSGWTDYGHSGATQGHYDHVHISFEDTKQTSAGNMGGGWPGANASAFSGGTDPGGGLDPSGVNASDGGSSESMLNFNWAPHASVASQVLTGYRALMNDVPLLSSIDKVAKASMRSYMAAPNGDFIAWFPDYFGTYGTAAKMNIRDLELAGDAFTIVWDDTRLVTHQYAVSSLTGVSNAPDDPAAPAGDLFKMATTEGIASVEFPEVMEALFNVRRDDPRAKSWLNPEAILQRFGARPSVAGMGVIASPAMEFWYACRMFQKNWAAQFSSKVQLTFMPEVWPGMLLKLETFGFQAYVEAVTHTFDFMGGMGGGFRTDVSVIAPSSTKGGGLYGLPVVKKSEGP